MPRKKVGRKIDVNGTLQDLGNTLSDADLEKFDTIERNAQKNVQADWNETDTSSSSYIRNKPSYDSWILGEFEKTSNLYFTPINSNSINLDFINNDLYRAGKLEDSYTMSMTLGKKYTLSFDAYLLDYADASTLWANVKLDNISIQKQGVSSGYYKLNTQNYTIGIGASNYTHISFTFTAPINVEDVTTSSLYFGFNKYSGSNIVGYPDKGLIVYIKNVMLNEGETALSYSIPFGQLLWTRDVVGVYAKEEDVPDESKLGSQLSLSLNTSDYKLTAKLLNSSNVVLSSKVVDLPLEEMVVDASYDSTTKKITLELKNGNTTSFSVADLVSGLVPKTRKINGKALSTDITLTQDDVGDGTTYKRVTSTEKTTWNNKSNFSGAYADLTGKPTIPTVNNGKLTIKRNNTEVGTFTANQSGNSTINIEAIDSNDKIYKFAQEEYNKSSNLLDKNKFIVDVNGKIGIDISNLVIGETYTFSSNFPILDFKISDKSNGLLSTGKYDTNGYNTYTFVMSKNSGISSSEKQYLFLGLTETDGQWITSISQLSNYNLQIEKGNIASPYQPYNSSSHITNGQADFLKSEYDKSKNLFNGNLQVGAWIFADGNYTWTNEYRCSTNYIDVVPGSTITLSVKGNYTVGGSGFVFYNNGSYVGYADHTFTATVPANANQVLFNIFIGSNSFNLTDIQLEYGSTDTPYQPYQGGRIAHVRDLGETVWEGSLLNGGSMTIDLSQYHYIEVYDHGGRCTKKEIYRNQWNWLSINYLNVVVGEGQYYDIVWVRYNDTTKYLEVKGYENQGAVSSFGITKIRGYKLW